MVSSATLPPQDFFDCFARYWFSCDVEKKLRLSSNDYWAKIIRPLKNKFIEEIDSGRIIKPNASYDVVPCALVLPEQLASLDDQFTFFKFKPNEVTRRIKLQFFSRNLPANGNVKPYLITNIRVRGPFTAPQYLGSIAQKLTSQKERFLCLEEVFAVLLARRVDINVAPWMVGGHKGEVVVGLSGQREVDRRGVERFSMPIVDFSVSCGAILNSFTADSKLTLSQYHRVFTCEKILMI